MAERGSTDGPLASLKRRHHDAGSAQPRARVIARLLREPRADRVAPGLGRHDERQLRLEERCELWRLVEHAAVGGDQPVPRSRVVVEGEQQLRSAWSGSRGSIWSILISSASLFGSPRGGRRSDRGDVVEREEPAHSRSPSGSGSSRRRPAARQIASTASVAALNLATTSWSPPKAHGQTFNERVKLAPGRLRVARTSQYRHRS